MMNIITEIFSKNGLVAAVLYVTAVMLIAHFIAKVTKQKNMTSAIAITMGLILAYIVGKVTGGDKGVSDFEMLSGVALLGGGMFRDFSIISTAYGADLKNIKKAGLPGVLSLFIGVFLSFFVGVIVAYFFGYTDPKELATIGGGSATFVVGPVVGSALGVSSEVVAVSIAAGVVKSVLVIIATPFLAPIIGLDNPTSAMVYGGLVGSTSGVAGGLATVDEKLVPYGAMTATFYTGLGSLLCPSVGYMLVNLIFG